MVVGRMIEEKDMTETIVFDATDWTEEDLQALFDVKNSFQGNIVDLCIRYKGSKKYLYEKRKLRGK